MNVLSTVQSHLDLRTFRYLAALVLILAVAGCGSSSVESKVADELGQDVSSCSAVGLAQVGKIYSCQTERSTVCVVVDGDDVFGATEQARQAGIAC